MKRTLLWLITCAAISMSVQADTEPAEEAAPERERREVIEATDTEALLAAEGRYVHVRGVVRRVEARPSGAVTRIHFHGIPEPEFHAPIFERSLKAITDVFGEDLETALVFKNVIVRGRISEYRGQPQIIVNHPGQILIQAEEEE